MNLKFILSSTSPPRVLTRAAMSHWAHHHQSPHLPVIQRPRLHLPPRFARRLRRARIFRRSSRSAMADDGGSGTPAPEEFPVGLQNAGGGSVTPAPEPSPENLRSGGSSSSSDSESGVGSGVNRLFGRKKPVHSVFGAGKRTDSSDFQYMVEWVWE